MLDGRGLTVSPNLNQKKQTILFLTPLLLMLRTSGIWPFLAAVRSFSTTTSANQSTMMRQAVLHTEFVLGMPGNKYTTWVALLSTPLIFQDHILMN
eukprot:6077034-Amphidinium_carterae.1